MRDLEPGAVVLRRSRPVHPDQRPRDQHVGVARGLTIDYGAVGIGPEGEQAARLLQVAAGPGPDAVERRLLSRRLGQEHRVRLPFADGVAPLVAAYDAPVGVDVCVQERLRGDLCRSIRGGTLGRGRVVAEQHRRPRGADNRRDEDDDPS